MWRLFGGISAPAVWPLSCGSGGTGPGQLPAPAIAQRPSAGPLPSRTQVFWDIPGLPAAVW